MKRTRCFKGLTNIMEDHFAPFKRNKLNSWFLLTVNALNARNVYPHLVEIEYCLPVLLSHKPLMVIQVGWGWEKIEVSFSNLITCTITLKQNFMF